MLKIIFYTATINIILRFYCFSPLFIHAFLNSVNVGSAEIFLESKTYLLIAYLPWLGKGNPSSVQDIWGVGFPDALHFKETAGPGCSVCSMKLYRRIGGASEI